MQNRILGKMIEEVFWNPSDTFSMHVSFPLAVPVRHNTGDCFGSTTGMFANRDQDSARSCPQEAD